MPESQTTSFIQQVAPFLAAIITAISTLVAVFLTNRSNENRLRIQLAKEHELKVKELKQGRLEEVYVLLGQYATALIIYYMPYSMAAQANMTVQEALDFNMKRGTKDAPDFQRIQMLVDLYFPELKPDFKVLLRVRNETSKQWTICEKILSATGKLDKANRQQFLIQYASIDISTEQLKQKMSTIAAA